MLRGCFACTRECAPKRWQFAQNMLSGPGGLSIVGCCTEEMEVWKVRCIVERKAEASAPDARNGVDMRRCVPAHCPKTAEKSKMAGRTFGRLSGHLQ
ncbi:hypothetical protein BDV12DRAFT_15700 [Aspergillus spectabilis]